jgi:hypothetical protein
VSCDCGEILMQLVSARKGLKALVELPDFNAIAIPSGSSLA